MAERKHQCKREGSSDTHVASEADECDKEGYDSLTRESEAAETKKPFKIRRMSSPELGGGSGERDRTATMSVPIGH